MNKFYGAHDQWTDLDKQNDVLITSTDGVIDSVKVNGEDYGGGSSDFSTVEVTLIGKDGALPGDVYLPIAQDAVVEQEMPDMAYVVANFFANETHTYKAIMYKGKVAGLVSNFERHPIESITGDAQEMGGGFILITGDCTITIA